MPDVTSCGGPDTPGEPTGPEVHDRLAEWVSDLTTLQELTEQLSRTKGLEDTLREVLGAGATLVGARRGIAVLETACGHGPSMTIGLGLGRAELGSLETVPRGATPHGRILDGTSAMEAVDADLLATPSLDPRFREVLRSLGCAASYALPITTGNGERLGALVWLYDEPARPTERQRHLAGLYGRFAAEQLLARLTLDSAVTFADTLHEELLPSRLPRVKGVTLAARRYSGPRGGGDFYDALPLPEGALGLAVGSVSGGGASAVAAMGRLRASLRAYAVMEGEDPVAVLSDLELLLRITEPARSATALFAYCEPNRRKVVFSGAGHIPPLIVGERRCEFVETSLSAPLNMLNCWEAPSVELRPEPGETVLMCTDGLLRRTGEPTDRAYARLHAAATSVPPELRGDPGAVADHVVRMLLPDGQLEADSEEDVVLLAARFE